MTETATTVSRRWRQIDSGALSAEALLAFFLVCGALFAMLLSALAVS